MKQYDIAFSIGRACSCTESLRKAGLQYLSFPWDWVSTIGGRPDLTLRADITRNWFNGWMEIKDFVPDGNPGGPGKDRYVNRSTGVFYNHDFPKGIPIEQSFPEVRAKYDRRIKRLKELLDRSRTALIACIDMPNQKEPTSMEDCRMARAAFAKMFPHTQFDFVLFNRAPGLSFEKRIEECAEGWFTRIAFDYKDMRPGSEAHQIDLNATAVVLRSMFSVADYRTPEERKAFRHRIRLAKMKEVGAETAWQYFLFRRRCDAIRIANKLSPRVILARMRSRKYDHVLSLGVNCDAGFRFCQRWGFVDSTPFTWSQTFNLPMLTAALRDLSAIGTDGFTWHDQSCMWICNRTGLYFHGRMKASANRPPPKADALEADRDELRSRLAHLSAKFAAISSDASSKAFIYRINTKEAREQNIGSRLDEMQHALEAAGARNYVLVVVAERSARGLIPTAPNRVIRYLKALNPQSEVTRAEAGDPVGWNAIFTEFAPAIVKKATHRFKFEK